MTICDLTSGSGRLLRATKRLKQQWIETQAHWNDSACRRFEQSFVQPLFPEIQMAISAVERFAEVMQQAEKECGDRRDGE